MIRQCVSLLTVLLGFCPYYFIQCLKFKTHSSIFLNRFEALNLSLMQKMQNRRPASLSTGADHSLENVEQAPKGTPSAQAPVSTLGGGVKKKKKPKKK